MRRRSPSATRSATISAVTHVSPEQPVAVFDSGVGGLTVLHELLVSLPTEDYLYLGDTARFPYGTRTQQELQAFAVEIADHLLAAGAKLLVVACNAASSAALGTLEGHLAGRGLDVDVIGVVAPATQLAVAGSRTGRIGLLATPATVASGAYERAVSAADAHVHLESVACPDLAPIIQGGFPFDDARRRHRARVLRPAQAGRGRHRDPRLHALPAGGADAPADARPRRRARHLRRGRGPLSVERALRARGLLNPRREEGSYRFRCTERSGGVQSARHPLPADAARRGQPRRARRPGWPHEHRDPGPAAQLRPGAGRACARRASSPDSCAPRPARR